MNEYTRRDLSILRQQMMADHHTAHVIAIEHLHSATREQIDAMILCFLFLYAYNHPALCSSVDFPTFERKRVYLLVNDPRVHAADNV